MILALCSKGTDLDSELDERFGRCENFLIYDTEEETFLSLKNMAKDEAGGAGLLAVQLIVDQGAGVLIAPEVGPQGMDALIQFGIPVFKQGKSKTANAAIKAWSNHQLPLIEKNKSTGLRRA
ncbi:hypothetical protein EXM22_00550 [Oceanispirochaeta crateris]|uniref:Dinitrogenase iron-molybdenum cofactor biosynthesis domain-containing protein n=1 Tax=Oceanispirochaeta crateris TaxID=2518645 RepID=A0A5C1QHH0_9SPIO|nr:NifB/NifX family molybdenum-iron cluster-binding protein [Oceanispirochaeta crateris]QEN06549.1 hypothetical protein EXM22_00550 [Oceanispirochaeta crateris]